jgi:hypothetical protein
MLLDGSTGEWLSQSLGLGLLRVAKPSATTPKASFSRPRGERMPEVSYFEKDTAWAACFLKGIGLGFW